MCFISFHIKTYVIVNSIISLSGIFASLKQLKISYVRSTVPKEYYSAVHISVIKTYIAILPH